jgi:hypothetical protein
LVEAEQARCLRRDEQAAKSYEQAIQNARRNGYIHESALAAELAAEFYLAREQYPTAIDHLCTAYYGYLAWGATMKAADLIDRYPDLAADITDCLSGDVNKDFSRLWTAFREFVELPESLPVGEPLEQGAAPMAAAVAAAA